MGALASILPLLLCGALDLTAVVSPDQPLPFSYTDDPLVIELQSEAGAQVSGAKLNAQYPAENPGDKAAKAPEVIVDSPGTLSLRPRTPGLLAFPGLPAARGRFTAKLGLTVGNEAAELDITFARIERPSEKSTGSIPVYIHGVESVQQVIAARTAGAEAVAIGISNPKFGELLRAAMPMGVIASVRPDERDAIAAVNTLPADALKNIVRWSVDCGGDPAVLAAQAEAIRATPCKAPIAIMVQEALAFEALLKAGADKYTHSAVLASDVTTGKEARLLLDAAERAGHEGWPLHVLASGAGAATAPQRALQQVFANLGAGATSTGLSAGLLYDGEHMGDVFVALNALGRRLIATEHAGNLSLGSAIGAPLFRDGGRWVLAVWAEGNATQVTLNFKGVEDLHATDPFGNPLQITLADDGTAKVHVAAAPMLLSGSGGPLLGIAARQKAQATARRLLDDLNVQRWLAADLRAVVQSVIDQKGNLERPAILTLLRALPELEGQWHNGKMPCAAAGPAIADIARLCRNLSAVEEDEGKTYLEPMHDMLARSEEMQSIYLTGAGGGPDTHERGDWILDEVRHLIEESKKLSNAGRKIEATGVAALAEARARALEFAAKEGEKSRWTEAEVAAAGAAVPPAAPAPVTPPPAAEDMKKADEKADVADTKKVEPAKEDPKKAEPTKEAVAKEESAPVEKADEKLAPGQPKGTRKVTHTVVRGDSPESIAKKYGADYEAFRKANGLRAGAPLKAGRQYTVYAPVKNAPKKEADPAPEKPAAATDAGQPANTKKVTHKIAKGDNPSTIAKKYGVATADFLKWNKLKESARFQIGEEYVLYVPAKR